MNRDCLLSIAQFVAPKKAMQLASEYTGKFFPESITIRGHKQLEEFYGWAKCFNTGNLKEVRIVIDDDKLIESLRTDFPKAVRADGLVIASPIGLVPPSVQKLTLSVCTTELVRIPDTINEVIIEQMYYARSVELPDSVHSLQLLQGFSGVITRWPSNLEWLTIRGWCSGNGRWPVPISTLPDSVKHLTMGADLDIEIMRWPENLETVVIIGQPEDFGWSIEDADIPHWVKVFIVPSAVPVDADYDDYDDPSLEW